jgi:hypothetical protein
VSRVLALFNHPRLGECRNDGNSAEGENSQPMAGSLDSWRP